MTKLQFIDREISSTEIDIWYSNSILKETPQKEELKREMLEVKIKVLKQKMFMLQQIKTDLEAWEVVKKNIQEETQLCESILGTYYRNTLVIKRRGYDSCENKTEYDTLLKALEVEND